MVFYRKATSIVYFYARKYRVEDSLVWSFLDNLFGIRRGDRRAVLDPADRAELRAVFEDYMKDREASA